MGENIKERVGKLGEWITGFTINGEKFGGSYFSETDWRVLDFAKRIDSRLAGKQGARILECGCLEGGHTTTMSQLLKYSEIIAVDVREENLQKARLHAELKSCPNITFRKDDLEDPADCLNDNYDAIFCVGLLYHLRKPDVFLKRAARAAPYLWLWTVYCAETDAAVHEANFRGRIYAEPTEHPLSAVRNESFFPTLGSLMDMLWSAGYADVHLVKREMTLNGNGPAILLEATR